VKIRAVVSVPAV